MSVKQQSLSLLAILVLNQARLLAADPKVPELRPLMLITDHVVLKEDFSGRGPLDKEVWQARQGTRWAIEDGVLRGRPSSAEYQAKKTDHAGKDPRIAVPETPRECVAQFSVRFSGGEETKQVPLVEFGHHICRIRFSKEITELLANNDSLRVNEAKGFQYKPGVWYHMLWELQGEEVVVQIANGPTMYAKHSSYAEPVEKGAKGLGVAGPRDGMVEIDNVVIHSIKPGVQPTWEEKKKSLGTYQPVSVKAKTKAKN